MPEEENESNLSDEAMQWVTEVYAKSLQIIEDTLVDLIPGILSTDARRAAGTIVARLSNAGISVEKITEE